MAIKTYNCCECGKIITLEDSIPYKKTKHICFKCLRLKRQECTKCGKIQSEEKNFFIGEDCYCHSCYEKQMIIIQNKEREKKQWNNLFDYLCKIFNIKELPIKAIAILRRFKETYPEMTYIGMQSTMEFLYEIEEKKSLTVDDVGIIPYHYERAKKFFTDKHNLTQSIKTFFPQDLDKESVYVKIASPPKPIQTLKLIDISKIGVEDES